MKYTGILYLLCSSFFLKAQFASWSAYDTIHTPIYSAKLANASDVGMAYEVAYFFNGFIARIDYIYESPAFYVEERFEYGRFKHTYSFTKYYFENKQTNKNTSKHFLYNVFAVINAQTGNVTLSKDVLENTYAGETNLFTRLYIDTRNKRLKQAVDSLVVANDKKVQLKWVKIDSISDKEIQVFYSNDSLRKRPGKAYYAIIDIKNPNVILDMAVGEGSRYTPEEYYNKYHQPLLVVNTTFFNFDKNDNLNVVVDSGIVKAYNVPSIPYKKQRNGTDSVTRYHYPYRAAIGVRADKTIDAAWVYSDSMLKKNLAFEQYPYKLRDGDTPLPNMQKMQQLAQPWNMHVAFGGGPMLLQHGDWFVTNMEEHLFVKGAKDLHPRTAIGYTKEGKLIILVVEGRNEMALGASLLEEAEILKQLGCEEALNLDGGGSSCMLIHGKPTIQVSDKTGQRPVPAVFMVHRKK
jgi:hypothetical protein